jgi:hypothetical protein
MIFRNVDLLPNDTALQPQKTRILSNTAVRISKLTQNLSLTDTSFYEKHVKLYVTIICHHRWFTVNRSNGTIRYGYEHGITNM